MAGLSVTGPRQASLGTAIPRHNRSLYFFATSENSDRFELADATAIAPYAIHIHWARKWWRECLRYYDMAESQEPLS